MGEKDLKIKGIFVYAVLIGALAGLLGGCGFMNPQDSVAGTTVESGFVMMKPGLYDSEDTAIVVKKNTEESTIQLQNLQTGKRYTLSYDGATMLYDKYSAIKAICQIKKSPEKCILHQKALLVPLCGCGAFDLFLFQWYIMYQEKIKRIRICLSIQQ